MHYKLLHPSKWLYAADLKGKDVVLTIREVVMEPAFNQKKNKNEPVPVVYFEETKGKGGEEKRLLLNKTNTATIAQLHGVETGEWKGKKICLFPTTTRRGGETVECIRVRKQVPK